ncbi:MAG: hypothetical protein DWI03_09350 [Planctomycetota bacterium]|nr:MAG: hypothetical protein DWI03_09350 [Planctomycetota bacterium]
MPSRTLHGLILALLVAIAPFSAGCSTLLTVAYLVQPADVPAEFKGLRGKHVAVVCRPIVELQFSDAGSSRQLAGLVGSQLEQKLRNTKVIGQQEVARWLDENSWVDCPTLGKSLDADMVVGIDLEEFRLHEGSTLFRGRATAHVRVYDVAAKKVVFEKRLDDFSFPANTAIPTTDRSEAEFRDMFLQIVAQRISRTFHAYESREHFAEESLTF